MTVDPWKLLCCPACRRDLDRVSAEELQCVSCHFAFPIVNGIPVLFPCDVKEKMPELFQRYWDSESKADLYDQLVEGDNELFGTYNHESEVYGLVKFYDPGKLEVVLDAGCGNGRFLETFPANTYKVGLDASLALLVRTKRRGRGHFLVCAELEHLPFKDGTFSTVISCRVLQHLQRQQRAVEEICRVTQPEGDVVLELYNTWNPKTLYKNIRMSPRLRRLLNAPFRLVFRSMSPFADWGIAYDRYNGWFQVKRWLRSANMRDFHGRGVGFGFHKYFIDPFYLHAAMSKHTPGLLLRFYRASFRAEKLIGGIRPFSWVMEKFTIKATRRSA
jgi:ubiquinone/menaquinone biosynthesis C-methylase UbiE/uncharacterized protein YbaR (Trm112 family)